MKCEGISGLVPFVLPLGTPMMSFIVDIFAGIKDYVLPSMRYMRKTWSTRVERRRGISRSEDRGDRCSTKDEFEDTPAVTRREERRNRIERRVR